MKAWIEPIADMEACDEAVDWCEQFDSLDEAWQACECGDWMLWLLGMLSGPPESDSRKKLVLVVCQCARLALPYVKKGEMRPLKAIETAEAWARGDEGITLQDVRDAAAYAAAYAYASYAVTYAAYVAVSAASAVTDAAYVAASAANAAADAAYVAVSAASAAARAADAYASYAVTDAAFFDTLRECADIVREYYPVAPSMEGG